MDISLTWRNKVCLGVAGASAIYSGGSEFKSRPQDWLYWQICPNVPNYIFKVYKGNRITIPTKTMTYINTRKNTTDLVFTIWCNITDFNDICNNMKTCLYHREHNHCLGNTYCDHFFTLAVHFAIIFLISVTHFARTFLVSPLYLKQHLTLTFHSTSPFPTDYWIATHLSNINLSAETLWYNHAHHCTKCLRIIKQGTFFSKDFSATVLTRESIPYNTGLCTVSISYRPTHDKRHSNSCSSLWINNIGELVSIAMWLYYSADLCQAVVRIEFVLLFLLYNNARNIGMEKILR